MGFPLNFLYHTEELEDAFFIKIPNGYNFWILYCRGGQAHPPHPRFLNYRSVAREPHAAREPQFGQLCHISLNDSNDDEKKTKKEMLK